MSERPCTMVSLVEAAHDGRLAAPEQALVDNHLRVCAECASLKADFERIGQLVAVAEPTPLERRRGRLRLLVAASHAPSPPRRVWPAVASIAAAGVVAAVALSFVRAPSASPAMHIPQRISAPAPRSETWITAGKDARYERSSNRAGETVQLIEGAVDLAVRHLEPGERFIVRTDDAEVEVRGTIFHVAASGGILVETTVQEGRVEVRRGGKTWTLGAGESWRPPEERVAAAEAADRDPAPAGGARAELPAAPAPPRGRSHAGAHVGSPAPVATAEARGAEDGGDFAEGVRLVELGDAAGAKERLRRFAAAHPDDPRAEDAYILAILAARRAKDAAGVEELSAEYLQRFPHGQRRGEASRLRVEGTASPPTPVPSAH